MGKSGWVGRCFALVVLDVGVGLILDEAAGLVLAIISKLPVCLSCNGVYFGDVIS